MKICNARFGAWALLISLLGSPFAPVLGAQTDVAVSLGEALDTVGTLSWGSVGTPSWLGQTLVSSDGLDAAESEAIGDNGSAAMQTTVTGPGTLTYWWKVSSQTNADRLFFHLDGLAQIAISGEVDWQQRTVALPAGNHTLEWQYTKNASLAAGQDRAWVDQVQFTSSSCMFVISPTEGIHNSGASTGFVSVATSTNCAWDVVTTNNWLTLLSSINGTGNGIVRYFVSPNAGFTRVGHLRIADRWFSMTQSGSTSAPCSYDISPASRAHGSGFSTNFVSVWTTNNCPWEVINTNAWVTIFSTNGSGSGKVGYTVADNFGPASRSGTLLVAGRVFTITQSGLHCSYSLSPSGRSYWGNAANDVVDIITAVNCPWSVLTTNAWITILSSPTGTGTGSVAYELAANPGPQQRTGYISIGGRTLTIHQATDPAIVTQPKSQTVPPGSTVVLSVTAVGTPPFTYQWQFNETPLADGNGLSGASTSNLTLTGVQDSQTGSYRVIVSNPTGVASSSAAPLTVTCGFALFPRYAGYSSNSANGFINVSAATNCLWTVVNTNSWITILSSETNLGNGTLLYSVAANPTTETRSGTILVAEQSFEISQSGDTPTNATVSLAEAVDTVGTLPWGTTRTPVWFGQSSVFHDGVDAAQSGSVGHGAAVTVQTTVTGPGTISFWWKVSSETNGDYLKFFINGVQQLRISGEVDWQLRSLPITATTNILKWTYSKNATNSAGLDKGWLDQVRFIPGTGCVVTISQTNATHPGISEMGQVNVTAAEGCTWAVASLSSWITPITYAGESNGYARYVVAANNSTASRTGLVTIAGQPFTVVQLGAPCIYSFSTPSQRIEYAAGYGSFGVIAPTGCTWTVGTTNDWITIRSTTNGSGYGSVSYSFTSNSTLFPRSGFIRVGDQLCPVIQSTIGIPFEEALDTVGTSLAWRSGGSSLWFGQSAVTHDGADAAQCGAVADWGNSGLATTVTGPGTLTFWWKVSSATNKGTLHFLLNSFELTSISGEVDWEQRTIAIPSGTQNLEWSYWKNAPGSGGEDRAWLDEVQFVPMVGCPVTLSPGIISTRSGASTGLVNVAAVADCAWSVFNTNAWISIVSGSNGTGNGTVTYIAAANPTHATRTGRLLIADKIFEMTQARICPSSLSPTNGVFDYRRTSRSVTVFAADCDWSVVINTNDWVTISEIRTNYGAGGGWVYYTVAANTNMSSRSGNIRIGDQVFLITQGGAGIPLPEALDTENAPLTWETDGANVWFGQSAVTHDGVDAAQSGAVPSDSWVSYLNSTLSTWVPGPGTLTFWWKASSATNRDGLFFYTNGLVESSISGEVDWRQRTVTILPGLQRVSWHYVRSNFVGRAGQDCGWVDRVQFVPAPECAKTISPTAASCSWGYSTGAVTIAAASGCAWGLAQNTNVWISLQAADNGTGTGAVTYMVEYNPTAFERSGYLDIAGQLFLVTQAGNPNPGCTFSLSLNSRTYGSGSVTGNWFRVTTQQGCMWDAVKTNSWITISSSLHNTNSAIVVYSLAPNTSPEARSSTIVAGGQVFLLTQLGTSQVGNTNPPCTISVSPGSRTHGYGSAIGTIAVTTQTNCAWSVGTTNSWISILSSSSSAGTGTVLYSLAPNTNSAARSGHITINWQRFLLTQWGTSSPGTNAPRLQLTSQTETNTALSVQGHDGKWYVVEYSDDLIHWTPISTNSAPSTIIDAPVGNAPRRFYRTAAVP